MQPYLSHLSQVFSQVPDPRSKRGTYQPLAGILALTFLGLPPVKTTSPPSVDGRKTIGKHSKNHSASPKKSRLTELQEAFAVFLSQLLQDKALTVAVDGKTSKQVLDEDGEVLQMLNTFVHEMKVVLLEWSIKGDKTNEPGCLKKHLGELLSHFPHLKILTGDAIFAQRPLLEVLKNHSVDYVFQVKENQPEVLDAVKETFKERHTIEPVAQSRSQKKVT